MALYLPCSEDLQIIFDYSVLDLIKARIFMGMVQLAIDSHSTLYLHHDCLLRVHIL